MGPPCPRTSGCSSGVTVRKSVHGVDGGPIGKSLGHQDLQDLQSVEEPEPQKSMFLPTSRIDYDGPRPDEEFLQATNASKATSLLGRPYRASRVRPFDPPGSAICAFCRDLSRTNGKSSRQRLTDKGPWSFAASTSTAWC